MKIIIRIHDIYPSYLVYKYQAFIKNSFIDTLRITIQSRRKSNAKEPKHYTHSVLHPYILSIFSDHDRTALWFPAQPHIFIRPSFHKEKKEDIHSVPSWGQSYMSRARAAEGQRRSSLLCRTRRTERISILIVLLLSLSLSLTAYLRSAFAYECM